MKAKIFIKNLFKIRYDKYNLVKCKNCGLKLDPYLREVLASLHGAVCSEECDLQLRNFYGWECDSICHHPEVF